METTTPKKKRAHRGAMQDLTPPTTIAETVRYRLRNIPKKALESEATRKDRKYCYAEVVPQSTLNLEALLERMERERLAVSSHTARMVLFTALDTIIQALKEGKRVTLDDYLTFGLSISGRVDPRKPNVRGKLELRPWVRCSQRMADRVNRGTQITHIGVTEPVPEHLPSYNRLKEAAKKPPKA